MNTQGATVATAPWVRVRLTDRDATARTGREPLTDGEIILRADDVVDEGEHIVFYVAGEAVFRLERCYFRSVARFVDRPTFGEWLRERRAQYPNMHRPWRPQDDAWLRAAITYPPVDWARAALVLGRTEASVKRRSSRLNRAAEG